MFKIRRICSRYTFVLSFDVVLTATCRTLINPSHSTAHQCRCRCRIKSDLAVVTLHANGMQMACIQNPQYNRICYQGAFAPHADLLSLGGRASQHACKANSQSE